MGNDLSPVNRSHLRGRPADPLGRSRFATWARAPEHEGVGLGLLERPAQARSGGWLPPVRLAWAAAVAATVLAFATAVLAAIGRDVSAFLVPEVLGWTWMGCVLLARRPDHPLGPLLCLIGLTTAIGGIVFAYERYALVHSPGSLPFATTMLWMNTYVWAPDIGLTLVLLLVFPDGRLLSRWSRPALWAALAFIPLAGVGNAFMPQSMGAYFRNQPNPYAVAWAEPVWVAVLFLALACMVYAAAAAVASIVLRWRRAGRVGRQQLKWFLAGLPVAIASWTVDVLALGPGSQALQLSLVLGSVSGVLTPVAFGIAVCRYRLYEIDILLNRAVLYGLLTAAVAAVYLTGVALAWSLFGVQEHSLAVQTVATAVAAAALFPMRDRVQRRVNRLFYGDRGVPYEALARLGRRVEESAGTESALNSMVKTIADSLRLPYAALELRLGDGWSPAACYGEAPSEVVAFPLISQRETVGRLLVGTRAPREKLGPDDERLLADLARQAGPTAHAVALRRALDASRGGLITAREEERRRLRRDLHDGLGPTLAGLTLGLDTARGRSAGQPELRELLGQLKAETQRAVTDVRRIVYGLRPPALDEFGLAGALRQEVARLEGQAPGLSITFRIRGEGLDGLPAAVEVAAYRIVTEAVTNVLRHTRASCCEISIWSGQQLRLEVCDDGAGMPEGWRAGVGITAMRERVAELGGELAIEPGRLHGTCITARLPVTGRGGS